MDGVAGEERSKFFIQLGGQRLVVGEHQGGFADLGNDICRRKGLAAACDAHKGLARPAVAKSPDEFLDGLGLIARRLKIALELKCR